MKRKLINSFIILTSTTLISKLFSLINRMMLSRLLNDEGMALYILVLPTLSLCITLAQFSIPSAVFRLVSHPNYRNKKVIISAILICGFSCILIVGGLLFFHQIIALNFLKQPQAIYPILCIIPFIPPCWYEWNYKELLLRERKCWSFSDSVYPRGKFTYYF